MKNGDTNKVFSGGRKIPGTFCDMFFLKTILDVQISPFARRDWKDHHNIYKREGTKVQRTSDTDEQLWTCLHEHQSWRFHWFCQVSFNAFPPPPSFCSRAKTVEYLNLSVSQADRNFYLKKIQRFRHFMSSQANLIDNSRIILF